MTEFIFDSTIVIDLLRQNPAALSWYASMTKRRIAITPIVWMETVQGARNNAERDQILRFLKQFPIEHPIEADNNWAMRQFARFHLGYGIELTDMMIASVAVRLSVPLYTLNIKHYVPLPGVNAVRPY